MIRKFLAIVALVAIPLAAYASCRYWTVTIDGKTMYCSECCYGSGSYRQCSVTCN